MQSFRSLYGQETLEIEDLIESKINHLVELAYYKIDTVDEAKTRYAVEIVKTEHLRNKVRTESKKVNLFTESEIKTNHILEMLKKNKVTPMGLRDTIVELVKTEAL